MAISKNTKKKYNSANASYKESSGVTNARNNLASMANRAPIFQNSYKDQLDNLYGLIKNGADFNYDSQNDAAYRRFAEEYNALSGLAIANNQTQAQGLTGGYGSTYAPKVANQGLATMKENVVNAQPLFMEQAQNAYVANNDAIKNKYQAAADARDDELENYSKQAEAYNNQYTMAQKRYSDTRDFDYNKYKDNRDFWATQYQNEQETSNFNSELVLKSYDVYNTLAANKCADYNEKKNNKGMKAYLDGLVKAGKITKYMADNLYKQYKYTAPKTSGGGGGSGTSGGSGGNGGDPLANWTPSKNNLMYINMRNRGESYETALNLIDVLVNKGQISKDERDKYAEYYKNKFTK